MYKRYCLALDLKNDAQAIASYKAYHKNVWPEVIEHLHNCGIVHLEIYNIENRLCMVITVNETFSFEKLAVMASLNSKVQEWEVLMETFQINLPNTPDGGKWRIMESICEIGD